MSLGEAQRAVPAAKLTIEEGADGPAVVLNVDTTGLIVIYTEESPGDSIDVNQKFDGVETFDPSCRTVSGIRVGSLLSDVERLLGKVTDFVISENESRQFVTFERMPPGYYFRVDYKGIFDSIEQRGRLASSPTPRSSRSPWLRATSLRKPRWAASELFALIRWIRRKGPRILEELLQVPRVDQPLELGLEAVAQDKSQLEVGAGQIVPQLPLVQTRDVRLRLHLQQQPIVDHNIGFERSNYLVVVIDRDRPFQLHTMSPARELFPKASDVDRLIEAVSQFVVGVIEGSNNRSCKPLVQKLHSSVSVSA